MEIERKKTIFSMQNEKFSQKEKFALFCFIVLSIEYVFHYYLESGALPKALIYINAVVACAFPIYALFTRRITKVKTNAYTATLFFEFIFILVYTVVLMPFNGRISRDIVCITVYLAILDAILYQDLDLKVLRRLFQISTVMAVAGFIFVAGKLNIDVEFAIHRGYQYDEIFYYAALFWCVTPFLILAILNKKDVPLALLGVVFNFLIQIIIAKRMLLLQLGILILTVFGIICAEPQSKGKKKTVLQFCLILGIAFLLIRIFAWDTVSALFRGVFDRTVEQTQSDDTFDRFLESKVFFNNTPFFDILIGKGFGGVHTGLGVVAEALHMGWCNFILKGGVVLFALMVCPYFKLLFSIKHYRQMPLKTKFAFWNLIAQFPMLFMSNMHSFTPSLFLFVYCSIEMMHY